jgi:WD40 repeat protein
VRKLLLVLAASGFLYSCTSMTSRLQANAQAGRIKSSHTQPVTGLLSGGAGDALFSWGEDGTVRIWDPATGDPRGMLRIGYRPVQKIALHPDQPQMAVLEGGAAGMSAALSVWDYESGKQLFSLPLEEQVLWLDYSAQGNYLLYSKADYSSMVVIDPRSGRKINYLKQGFGIVSFFVTSRNENNLMTYQPSGVICYRDIRTGKQLKKLSTTANLNGIRISPNLRFMIGYDAGGLEVVDLLTGEVMGRETADGLRELAFSPKGNEIVALREHGAVSALERYYFNGKALFKLSLSNELPSPHLSSLAYGSGGIYTADNASALYALRLDGSTDLLVRNHLMTLDDFDIHEEFMALTATEHIFIFSSDFFSASGGRGTALSQQVFDNPFSTPAGVLFLNAKELLVWRKGGEAALPGRLVVLDRRSGRILRSSSSTDFDTSLVQVEQSEHGLIVVEKSGRCRILDPDTFTTVFEYAAPGMNRLIAAGAESLIGAKSSLANRDMSPLLHINRLTGETVSIADSSIFLYDLLYDRTADGLFSLGIDRTGGELTTLLRFHFGSGLEKERILFKFRGEDLSADLVVDDGGRLYTSLGWRSVQVWEKGRLHQLPLSQGIPRKLESYGNMLYALNRDSTLTVWDPKRRRTLYTFYLFQEREPDGGYAWVALTPGGDVSASPGGRAYLAGRD